MTRPQAQWVLGALAVTAVTALCWFGVGHRGPHVEGAWLRAARPVLAGESSAADPSRELTLAVTNTGPRAIRIYLAWFECRAENEEVPLFSSERSPVPTFELRPGHFTNLTWTLPSPTMPSADPLFCAMLQWSEAPPGLTRAFQGSYLAEVGRMIDDIHVFGAAPWHWTSEVQGTVFASTAGVEDYFQRAYGWTYASVAEEQAVLLTAAQQSTPTFRYGRTPTPQESLRWKAKHVLLSWRHERGR